MAKISSRARTLAVGVALTTAASTATALVATTPAGADPARYGPGKLTVVKTLSSSFVGPLQFDVSGRQVYVADSFTATLWQVGNPVPLAHNDDPPGDSEEATADLSGVAVDPGSGVIAFAETNADHSDTRLMLRYPNGTVTRLASLSTFEAQANPDQVNHYGTDSTNQCLLDFLDQAHIPAAYTGQVDSHPYAVAALGNGAWAVADAGGNDILKVDRSGRISVLSVLPPQPIKITADIATANGLPACAVGETYKFEPVPTDVEVGPWGALFVSTLPGGLEAPGAGSVYTIGFHGYPIKIATGFSNATNLAVTPLGQIYVAELGAGRISQAWFGRAVPVLQLPGVAGVEYGNGRLYASTAPAVTGQNPATNPGTVVLLG